jgi:chromosome segregation ATPase
MTENFGQHCLHHSGTERALKAICDKLDEREKYVNMKFQELEKHDALQKKEHEKQIANARDDIERRLESMNEFRAQLEKQAANFLTRSEYETKHDMIVNRISANMDTINGLRNELREKLGERKWLTAIISVFISAIVFLISHFLLRISI